MIKDGRALSVQHLQQMLIQIKINKFYLCKTLHMVRINHSYFNPSAHRHNLIHCGMLTCKIKVNVLSELCTHLPDYMSDFSLKGK